MTMDVLAQSMIKQAHQRLKVLSFYLDDQAFGVAVRESQEVVELGLKAILRLCAIEPPKIHDVGSHLIANKDRILSLAQIDVDALAQASKSLRKDREIAFYGEVDFIPTDSYTREQAEQAIAWAHQVTNAADLVLVSSHNHS